MESPNVVATLRQERERLTKLAAEHNADPKIAARRKELLDELASLDEFASQIRSVDRAIHALENPSRPRSGGGTLSPEHREKIKEGLKKHNLAVKEYKESQKPTTTAAVPPKARK